MTELSARTSGMSFKTCNVYAKEKCRNCFAKFYCSGGCAANSWNFHGRINDTYDLGCELQRKRIECAIMIKAALAEEEAVNEKEQSDHLCPAVFVLLLAGLGYTATVGLGVDGSGSAGSINLGLDLEGGVSITYQVVGDEKPSSEDMSDTIYKLQQRVDGYSTESCGISGR